jgi:tetraacyldisaccharide 4'-kinase
LLAEKLLGHHVAVVSDANRVAAAGWALKNLRSEVFILDDGFQHLRIGRDLNILTLDATDPWGGGHLLPRGRLREPLGEMKRADLIVVTRAELAGDAGDLRARAESLSRGRPVLLARTATLRISPLLSRASGATNGTPEPDEIPQSLADHIPQSLADHIPQPLAAFCAIGNPQAFFAHARNESLTLNYTRSFTDHHAYTQRDVDDCLREAVRHGARALLTTAKDAVKLRALRFALPCYVLEVALKFDEERSMRDILNECISGRVRL